MELKNTIFVIYKFTFVIYNIYDDKTIGTQPKEVKISESFNLHQVRSELKIFSGTNHCSDLQNNGPSPLPAHDGCLGGFYLFIPLTDPSLTRVG